MAERALIEILKCQDEILNKLKKVLEQEYAVLSERKALELNAINEEKSKLLLELQTNDQSIRCHSERDRLKNDYDKFRIILNKKLADVQKQNEVNGRLVDLNLAANRRLAQALIEIRDRNTMTYDNKGNQNAIRGKHFNFEA